MIEWALFTTTTTFFCLDTAITAKEGGTIIHGLWNCTNVSIDVFRSMDIIHLIPTSGVQKNLVR
jgi:hypothetical protein